MVNIDQKQSWINKILTMVQYKQMTKPEANKLINQIRELIEKEEKIKKSLQNPQ